MNELSNSIFTYYQDHFQELSTEKQFHFASRLYMWNGDPFAQEVLDGLRPFFTEQEQPLESARRVYATGLEPIDPTHINAFTLREPYFTKHPTLRATNGLMFRILFLKTIYGIDIRPSLNEIADESVVRALAHDLLADTSGLAWLSTYAVNMLYVYSRFFLEDEKLFDPALFIERVAPQYDMHDFAHIQLFIYLYTHCIIGESLFYTRDIPAAKLAVCQRMLRELEDCITANYASIHLDNKFEFLVCAKLAGYTSPLADRIQAEAEQSVSTDGHYLIDRHNENPQHNKATLELSEHRNVLYLLASMPRQAR